MTTTTTPDLGKVTESREAYCQEHVAMAHLLELQQVLDENYDDIDKQVDRVLERSLRALAARLVARIRGEIDDQDLP
jgi:hypothetical protein